MKLPLSWLREWVEVPWAAPELGARLTMAGFELEGSGPAAPEFTQVIIAQIVSAEPHPQADKLKVCGVTNGRGEPLQIVCGASNARAGLVTALATVGARLPGGLEIKAAKLRGIESAGMLCSTKELGLGEDAEGIIELPQDAPLGASLREFLALDETVLEFNVTANRGDAMSVIGLAREVAALSGAAVAGPRWTPVAASSPDTLPVRLEWSEAAPKFVGRIVRGVDNHRPTPLWMRERLRRAGSRSISPVVDVTNYVLLELGQPMHAYDLAKLRGGLRARAARAGERVTLLDGSEHELAADVAVIADEEGAVGLAGIMGGARTAVTPATRDVFLEAAFFAPPFIAGRARRFGLQTDASQRFERGVDPANPEQAMQRATQLLVSIAGGEAGPVRVEEDRARLPARASVHLRRARLAHLLGAAPADERVEMSLRGLQMQVIGVPGGWDVTAPSHRFDIAIEEDLIEEVARIVGFEAIAEADAGSTQAFRARPEERAGEASILHVLTARGYQEAITFAFVDPAEQQLLFPAAQTTTLTNPIASDLAVMRVSLWPGLLRATRDNARRQQDRVRLFEHGVRFVTEGDTTREIDSLAGVAFGYREPEQWSVPREKVDFFDVKRDLEALITAAGDEAAFSFVPATLACLHPGRSACVHRSGAAIGWLGELHPGLVKALDLTYVPVLFEVDFEALSQVKSPAYQEISRFPQVRRDLAVIVDESVPLSALRERVTSTASSLLRDLRVFDLYRGSGIEKGRKSVALGLIFQDNSRTLTDEDVHRVMAAICADLTASLHAKIRE